LTSEQLQSTRAERWRQASNPILTAEDAKAWIDGVGFCLFLPRRAHFYTPAPSFVGAVAGIPSEAPGRDAIENAAAMLHRLTADNAVVPLSLFGAAGGTVFDQPDFLATRETLPYVFSLIGGRNWKSGPGAKASPLMTEIWTLLNNGEARTAQEIQNTLGRELTQTAVLRGLVELWNGLRVIPVYDGEVTRWNLTQARFAAEMTASQKVAQTTALSVLVSLYLESAVAASSEEIETFLSPLTARSRVHEVVNGLSATRQLGLISVGAQPLLHVAGSLPEFAEPEPEAKSQASGERRPPFEPKPRATTEGGAARRPFERRDRPQDRQERTGFNRGGRGERTGGERTGPPRERRESARPGSERYAARGEGRPRPERRPDEGERRPYGKKPFEKSQRPSGPRPFDRSHPPSGGGGKFPPKKFGQGGPKPWQDRGERPAGEGERPFRPRREEERGGERRPGKFGGAGKPGEKRFGGPRKSVGPKFGPAKKFGPRSGPGERGPSRWSGPRPSGSRPSGSRPSGSRPSGPRSAGSERPPFSGGFKREKPGEKRPFFRERQPKSEGEQPRREPRTGEGRPANRAGEWKPRPSGGGFSKSGGRSFGKSGKPAFKSGGKPGFKSGSGSGFKKAGFGKSARPFGKSAKPFGKSAGPGRSGKPAAGRAKPGGFKSPFRKRKKEGGENAE
jgi:hypothetical protein